MRSRVLFTSRSIRLRRLMPWLTRLGALLCTLRALPGFRQQRANPARRNNWRDRFFERVEGFSQERIPSSFIFTEYSGEQRRGMPVPTVVGKLRRRQSMTADDFAFLKPLTRQTAKATLPSPSVNHFFSGDKSLAGSPYRDRHAFFADVVAIYRQEIADLAAAGCAICRSARFRSPCCAIRATRRSSGRVARTLRS